MSAGPSSQEWERLYSELGRMNVAWSSIESQLSSLATRMLAGDAYSGRVVFARVAASRLLEMCSSGLAVVGDDSWRKRIETWLRSVNEVRVARNRFVHGTWSDSGGTPSLSDEGFDRKMGWATDVVEIGNLERQISQLVSHIDALASGAPNPTVADLNLMHQSIISRSVNLNFSDQVTMRDQAE